MDKWAELRTAYQVAKLGTVSAAASVLKVHRATVNRHIDALEEAIGAKIFIRHTRGYTLTETGHDVLRVAQKADELIVDLASRIEGGKTNIDGEIKLTILEPFVGLLMGAIADFRSRHPACRVDIDVGQDLARLEYGEAHIAVRAGSKPDHPDYVVSSFGNVSLNLYAHELYIEQHGLWTADGDQTDHFFVLPRLASSQLPFFDWINQHIKPEMTALLTPDMWVAKESVVEGIAMGFLTDEEARKRGSLTAVLPPNPEWKIPSWIVTHVDLHHTEKVQAMLASLNTVKATLFGCASE